MATKILVPLVDGFEEIEVAAVVDILRRAGIEVITAGLGGNIVTGAHNIRVNSDARMLDINADGFSGIVLHGGSPGTDNLMRSERVTNIVDDFSKQGKLVAAICAAPRILAKLGLLKERKATIYPGYEKELGKPRNDPVVADGNVITSQGPGTAVAFALKIVEQLMGKPKMLQIKQDIVA